jgi:hypothetical protein
VIASAGRVGKQLAERVAHTPSAARFVPLQGRDDRLVTRVDRILGEPVQQGHSIVEDIKKVPPETSRTLQKPDLAIERGLAFLERDAAKWRKERGCATCHHGTMTVWALSAAKAQGFLVRAEVLAEMVQWTKDRLAPRPSGPLARQPGSASIPLVYLGTMSQTLPILSRDEMNQIAVHLAARQGEDGDWELPPPKNGPPPTWESRETVALLQLAKENRHPERRRSSSSASRQSVMR